MKTTTTQRPRTNSKQIKQAFRRHVVECITNDGETIADAVHTIEEEFRHYSNAYVRHTHPNRQDRFISWMWGLPGCTNQLFEDFKILQFMEKIGLPLPDDKTPDDATALYMRLFYREYMDIKRDVENTES